jgi:hypothetical protein
MKILREDKKHKMYQDGGMVDPVALSMSVIGAGADFAASQRQKKFYEQLAEEEAARYKQSEGLYKSTLRDLMSEKYDREEMGVSQEIAAAKDAAVAASRQLVDEAREKGAQDTASILNVLDSGDPALAAVAVSQLDDTSGGTNEAKQMALNMANQAEAAFGAEAAKVDAYNVGVRDDNRSRLAALASLELQRGATGMDPDRELQARMTAEGASPFAEALGSGISTYQAALDEDRLRDIGSFFNAEEGGKFVGEEGGVSNSTTRGEQFSHEENPIHMIDEDGQKVGEMTGGEYIFDPNTTSDIKELVDKGDARGLLNYLDNLLSQPRFK